MAFLSFLWYAFFTNHDLYLAGTLLVVFVCFYFFLLACHFIVFPQFDIIDDPVLSMLGPLYLRNSKLLTNHT